jgi:hypothetical protein
MRANMEMKIRAARHLVYEANVVLDEQLGGDVIITASAKCFAPDTAMQVRYPEFDWRNGHENLAHLFETLSTRASFAQTVPTAQVMPQEP